ncbi:MAG TPA: S8 family serine peptidase, partial [Opitutaceae bacterium]|nr:S8 family serine peptidase [Opitutaceae bacterium]
SSTLLSAVKAAVQNGPARVINMSLGGGQQSQTEKKGMDQLYNNSGVLLIASAGNAGNTTTSYPAGYASVMSVAAIAENKSLASFSQRNSTVEIAAPGVAVLSTTSYIANTTVAAGGDVINAVPVEFAAYGTRTGTLVDGGFGGSQNSAWDGKVVLVQRGDGISFYDKVRNVQLSGGVACIIYNNLEETLYATLGPGNSSTIPAVGLSLSQGNNLMANLGQSTTVTSEFTQPAAGYDYFDGTSMAAPHVSGVAALIWSKYFNATNKQVRQALIESAEDLGTAGRDNSFGWGLVRANDAMTRLGQLVGGGGGPDTTPPVISNVSTATSKGKPGAQGSFTVSFTTNEPATSIVSIPALGSNGTKTTSLGTSHTVTFQGVKGATYSGTITATDAATNSSSAPFTRNN